MSKSTETKNLLKRLANDAKERLKCGNYDCSAEVSRVKKNMAIENHLRLIAGSECRKPEITIKIINDFSENEIFEKQVVKLLTENSDCSNPLKLLADEQLFNSLSETDRQRYILDLSERYTLVKDNYYKQKLANQF